MTPDNIKYANTPTAQENVWGSGLRDAKRQNRNTARLDVLQSVTGLILGLFLFAHMAFTSSVQLGEDVFANLIRISGGAFIGGEEHAIFHVVFVGFIFLMVAIHAFCALRRFPTSWHQLRDILAHYKMLRHEDTTLWIVQLFTGFLLFFFVFTHLMPMLFNPEGFDVNLIGLHTYDNGMIYTFIFLVITELHGMIGLYRLACKWDFFEKSPERDVLAQNEKTRHGFRRAMLIVCGLMIVCGTLTAWKNYSIGEKVSQMSEFHDMHYQLTPENTWSITK